MKKDEHPIHILLIEDNPGDALLVEEYLSEHILRPELVHVKKFTDCIFLLEERKDDFDVILLDLSLPDISKEMLMIKAGELSQTIPVIMLTGFGDMEFATKSLSLGVSDYLVKDTINSLILYKSILYSVERHRFIRSLRESEKRYMELFHLSPAPMWVYNLETLSFMDVNMAAIRHYGYSRDEFMAMTLKDIRPKEEIPKLEEAVSQLPEKNYFTYKNIFKHQKNDGTEIFAEISSNSIKFNGEKAQLVLAADVTEKLLQVKAIEKQNKKLKEIAWTQSHIVRAPVARLMALIDLLKNEELHTTEKNELLGYILSSAEEIDRIIMEISNKSQSVFDVEKE